MIGFEETTSFWVVFLVFIGFNENEEDRGKKKMMEIT